MNSDAQRKVWAVAGRRIDARDAVVSRFPSDSIDGVLTQLRTRIASDNPQAVVASAACGADLLALQAASEQGSALHVVMPWDSATFRGVSVDDCGADWTERFERLVHNAPPPEMHTLDCARDDPDAFERATIAILDTARQLAESLHAQVVSVVVWDGTRKESGDITAQFLDVSRSRGLEVVEIFTLGEPSSR